MFWKRKQKAKAFYGKIPTMPTAYIRLPLFVRIWVCAGFSVCTVEVCVWMPVWVWDLMLCTFVFVEQSIIQSFSLFIIIPETSLARQSHFSSDGATSTHACKYPRTLKSISQNMHVGAHIHSMLHCSCSSSLHLKWLLASCSVALLYPSS